MIFLNFLLKAGSGQSCLTPEKCILALMYAMLLTLQSKNTVPFSTNTD
jgi:hypothetical protein